MITAIVSAVLAAQAAPPSFAQLQQIKDSGINAAVSRAFSDPSDLEAGVDEAASIRLEQWAARPAAEPAQIAMQLKEGQAMLDFAFVRQDGKEPELYGSLIWQADGQPQVKTLRLAQGTAYAALQATCLAHSKNLFESKTDLPSSGDLRARLAESVQLRSLSRALVHPFSADLGRFNRLIISPDGPLWAVSFGTLSPKEGDGNWLGSRVQISHAISPSSWLYFAQRDLPEPKSKGASFFAEPAFNREEIEGSADLKRAISADARAISGDARSASSVAADLTGFAARMTEAARFSPQAQVVTGSEASLAALSEGFSESQTVVAAAFVFLNGQTPSNSALIVAPDGEDGTSLAPLKFLAGRPYGARVLMLPYADIMANGVLVESSYVPALVAALSGGSTLVVAGHWRARADSAFVEAAKAAARGTTADAADRLKAAANAIRTSRTGWHPYFWARYLSVEG